MQGAPQNQHIEECLVEQSKGFWISTTRCFYLSLGTNLRGDGQRQTLAEKSLAAALIPDSAGWGHRDKELHMDTEPQHVHWGGSPAEWCLNHLQGCSVVQSGKF